MVSRIVLCILTACAASPTEPSGVAPKKGGSSSATPLVGDLSGYYVCKGQEVNGKTYTGVAMLIKKNEVYLIQWMVGGGSTFSGLAIRQGDTLAASWTMPSDRGGVVRGINMYRIDPGPRLVGRWSAVPGPGIMQSETLTFLRRLELDD